MVTFYAYSIGRPGRLSRDWGLSLAISPWPHSVASAPPMIKDAPGPVPAWPESQSAGRLRAGMRWGPAPERPCRASGAGIHDAVIGAACPGAARTGTVAAQHLRGGPAVQLHQVTLSTAPVQPRVAEMVTEPMRVNLHPALPAAPDDHLVNAAGGHRPPVVHPEPQLRPERLAMPGPDPDIAVEPASSLAPNPDDPHLAALAALAALAVDPDLPLPQVKVAASRVTRVM